MANLTPEPWAPQSEPEPRRSEDKIPMIPITKDQEMGLKEALRAEHLIGLKARDFSELNDDEKYAFYSKLGLFINVVRIYNSIANQKGGQENG